MKFTRGPKLAATMAVAAVGLVWGTQAISAQAGQPTGDLQAYASCSALDVTSTVATALSITPAELRKDIVSGQTLQQIATSKNLDIQTITTAIQTASKADIAQAVTDGILTQAEATALESGNLRGAGGPPAQGNQQNGQGVQPQGTPGAQPGGQALQGTPPAGGQGGQGRGGPGPRGGQFGGRGGPQGGLPDISNLRFMLQSGTQSTPAAPTIPNVQGNGGQRGRGFGGGFVGANFDVVKPYTVIAQALNMKCGDLVKTLATTQGKTIAAVATDQKVDTATVTDALSKAYKAALAQDVTDTVITQAQSDQVSANLDQAVANFVNNANTRQPGARPTQAQ